jgi:pantoate--beta-alanine ligase
MTAVLQGIAECKSVAAGIRWQDALGLVPTMGLLHDGHGALLGEARRRCSIVLASIFVNPIQFDQRSDLDLYPRLLDDDIAFCQAHGVDYVFAPSEAEMYPQTQHAFVDVEELSEHLCGRHRPGHFRGVATVVVKLFQIVQPRFAFFGEKDYQQLTIVRCLVRELNVPLEVVAVPTVREPDGLAMSSRNRRLSPEERALAPSLYGALLAAQKAIAAGETRTDEITKQATRILHRPEIRIEYFDLVDPGTLRPVEVVDAPVRAAAAVWIGNTRLIDNVLCTPPPVPR